ncbi:Cyclopropane-fatty-acyl-phospholipid synthase [Cordyceps militaris]|uniref:Cyclopropane-fatty-acyl-phospholipid synthase n=1 Tax=Cordyceps militaris TaxID=73501 RepID=A0A2H4SJT4_CORMI|nr:Cyclopropane-fatty-acyl-phospholipid synthase [Cordyceps militaris]
MTASPSVSRPTKRNHQRSLSLTHFDTPESHLCHSHQPGSPLQPMDSIDDSPLSLTVVHIADLADRFRNWPQAILVFTAFSLYYALLSRRSHVLLIAAAVAAFTSPSALARHVPSLLGAAVIAACSLVALRLAILTTAHVFLDAPTRSAGSSVFLPSRTTHTRFFPEKHSFAYSYLTVGVPVGLRARNVNGILAVDAPPSARGSWWARLASPLYEVDAARHLARGPDGGGLRAKLDRFLASQSVDPGDYPHAFLVTAPVFLGYSFNPVSFWYLYSPAKVLSAMILEVNNTFDERRPYLVFRDFDQEAKHIQSTDPTSTNTTPSKIAASFEKDFHVSPFNSRKGSYSLLAKDPLGPGMAAFRGLDVTITLQSSKGHPKLVARLVNQHDAVDVAAMTALRKLRFVCRYFWIGFATFPRIVKEAAALFFRRRLHVWFRPEPRAQSLGRHATSTERRLEAVFRAYLRHRVEQAPEALRVRYVASGITPADAAEHVFASSTAPAMSSACDVELRVLTPVFYARFVHYAHDVEGLFNELTESCTVAVDNPDMLPHIFLKKAPPPLLRASGVLEYAAFKVIQVLRRMPAAIKRPMTSAEWSAAPPCKPVDIREFRISPMDAYVLEHGSDSVKRTYRAAVVRLFLADRFFLGSLELLSAVELLCVAGVAYLFISAFKRS